MIYFDMERRMNGRKVGIHYWCPSDWSKFLSPLLDWEHFVPVCASMRIGEQLVLEVKCVSDPLRVFLKLTVFQLPQLQPVLLFLQDDESSAGSCCDHHHPNDKWIGIENHKRPKPVDDMIIDQLIYLLSGQVLHKKHRLRLQTSVLNMSHWFDKPFQPFQWSLACQTWLHSFK